MYEWRKLNKKEQKELLEHRKTNKKPWHTPPHIHSSKTYFLITAACYEHKPVIGLTMERMDEFETLLCECAKNCVESINAWVVLPNHYHILVKTNDVFEILKSIGQLHGKTSYLWNGEENKRGRQVWHGAAENGIKSERHFWAAINYIYNNPVKHGYVEKWGDWPFSSFNYYLNDVGREEAEEIWREYDISDMGKEWDV